MELTALSKCPCLFSDHYYFSRMASFGYYEDGIKEVIGAFKYKKHKNLAEPLGIILALYLNDKLSWNDIDCIVPIPVYNDVLQKRGFNQSALLAEVIGRELGKLVSQKMLIKISPTEDQSKLSRQERMENVKGAFISGNECKGKRILLVDDVFTTGSTVNEASRVLKEGGALSISVITLAKSVLYTSGQDNNISDDLEIGNEF